jgi:hypothetical protein
MKSQINMVNTLGLIVMVDSEIVISFIESVFVNFAQNMPLKRVRSKYINGICQTVRTLCPLLSRTSQITFFEYNNFHTNTPQKIIKVLKFCTTLIAPNFK